MNCAVRLICSLLTLAVLLTPAAVLAAPNLIFIFTDDQRHDALGAAGNSALHTPHMDALAGRGVRFTNAFVTLSICGPSRAAVLTGRYGSATGVDFNGAPLRRGAVTFAEYLRQAGYATALIGKWHLPNVSPLDCGFEESVWFVSNGPHWNRRVLVQGEPEIAPGFIEDYLAGRSIDFIRRAVKSGKPFVLHHCTQVPHMTPQFDWRPRDATLARYRLEEMPLPGNWDDDLAGKPAYLAGARPRQRALEYGYDRPEGIRDHYRQYYAAITDTDAALGRLLAAVEQLGLADSTYVILLGDNGWMIGDHGLTSKVLAYEPSIRVPLVIAGPGIEPGMRSEMVLNIDVMPTLLDLAGRELPGNLHGRSLAALLRGEAAPWRDAFLYEAPVPELGSWPHYAVRTERWKYIRTFDAVDRQRLVFEELYDLHADPLERKNLAGEAAYQGQVELLRKRLEALRAEIAAVP